MSPGIGTILRGLAMTRSAKQPLPVIATTRRRRPGNADFHRQRR
jgi:hypothetical protein